MILDLDNIPKEWEYLKISDVMFFQEGPGVRKWQFTKEGVKLLNVGNINNGRVNLNATKIYISEEEAKGKYSHFLVDEGDLLIACSGIVVDNFHNKIAFAKREHLPLCLNTSTMRFRALDESRVDLNYFRYYLQSILFKAQLRKLITGSAQLNFGPSHIKKINLLLPPLETQRHIANILDQADTLRKKTKEIINNYDQLAQSIFLDIFGDPVTNPKGWEKMKLGDISKIGSGSTPSRKNEDYYKGNIPWIKTTELRGVKIFDSLEKISEDAIKKSSCKLYPKGTILIAMYGQGVTRGKVGIIDIEAATNQACAAIPPSDKMNFDYLFNVLKYSYNELRSLGRGGNQPNMNVGLVSSFSVFNPPFSLQTQFADRIANIEQQKELAQQSLKEADDLFNALLQKAFKGELLPAETTACLSENA